MENTFKPKFSFEIENSKGFFEKLENEYSDFDKEHLNPRHAINCAINSWHLTDWTYQEFYNEDERFKDSKVNGKFHSGLVKYQEYLKETCPELEYMRIIANGIKHCKINTKDKKERTAITNGDFSPYDYSRHDFLVPRFIIILENNKEIDFEKTLITTIDFWRDFINEKYN